jgi:hypothetical protein
MSSLLGGGVCPLEGGGGALPSLPWWGGGDGERGAGAGQMLITCPGSKGTLCPCSLLMIRVGRSWNPLLLLTGPRSSSLLTSWVPGPLAVYFLPLFLVAVIGKGQLKIAIRRRDNVSIMNWVGMGGGDRTASLENLPNTFCKKSAKHWRVCGRFLICLPAIDRYWENTCEIFNMINTIAGEHILGSIKFNNVYACYRLNSAQTSPAIYRHLKCVYQNFF